MTPLALRMETAPARSRRRFRRAPLAMKLAIAFLGLVALVLLVNGAVDTYLTYNQAKRAALEVESEKARGAAERVGAFLADIQTQLGWTTGVEWGYAKLEQQRYDFIRLLRQAPAITALSYIDGRGREQIAVSRLEPDSIASGKDFSADPRFLRAVADKIWFGPVEFRRGSEPYMTIALAHVGRTPGVTVADVNLKLVWDVVSAIHVGDKGFAYVVDDHGRLIAHPDLSLVLRDSDFSGLPQVAEAMKGQGGGAAEAKSLDGAAVLTAFAIEPKTHWAVFVEQPLSEALAAAYATLARAAGLLGLGLLLAAVTGVALARRMAAPIRALQTGAERLGAGDLSQRLDIRTGDEIEALAGGFNRMAERLQESYENLEGKVEARTKDLNEALERQTATSEILKVIASSPSDARPVFDAIALAGNRLLRSSSGVFACDETSYWPITAAIEGRLASLYGPTKAPIDVNENFPSRAIVSGQTYNLPDWSQIELPEVERRVAAESGFRSTLYLPLMKEGKCLGLLTFGNTQAGHFAPSEIALAESFRDQALIAVENARLFEQVQARTRDLEESLAQQTATAQVLQTISRSAFDLDAVFQTLVATAVDLCNASSGTLCVRDGDAFRYRGMAGPEASPDLQRYLIAHPLSPPTRQTAAGRAILSRQTEQIEDVLTEPDYAVPFGAHGSEARALLGVPLLGKDEVLGAIVLARAEPGAFPPRHVEILRTFADQAVIAIENARLFDEVQEALRRQTATSNILGVIAASPTNLDLVLGRLAQTICELCFAGDATVLLRQDDRLHRAGHFGPIEPADVTGRPINRDWVAGRAIVDGQAVNVPDLDAAGDEFPAAAGKSGFARDPVTGRMRWRAILAMPLRGESQSIGVVVLRRVEPVAFSEAQVALLRTFCDQALIAIQNARLFAEVQTRTRELELSLEDLRKTQDRLVQSEKLASLGQLTAGIAHEIKNPLNFVNNFAGLSRELLEELRETLQRLPDDARAEADELMGMIDSNLEKVASHGKRADSIVKNMLLHSREGSGERSRVNVNAMVEEALNLGYHGARAEKPGFNVTIEKALDPDAGEADLYLQEVTRVLLNLISNGFYASAKRKQSEGAGYEPTLRAATRSLGASVEIRIRDNGAGIPDEVRAKMFNPFFTTKPAGEGTGLGLSLSHDIVVKQHGGTLDVETVMGGGAEFVITLPREGAGA